MRQDSEVGMKNICLLPTAFCLLPSADCLLNLRGVPVGGTLRPHSNLGQNAFFAAEKETVVTLKVKERRGNVYENKGSAFDRRRQSANVIENKDSYALKAGMLCAPQRRGSPVGGSPTQIVVGKSGS